MDQEITANELVMRSQSGDREAFEALSVRFHDDVDHFVRVRVGSHLRTQIQIEDLVQETFTRAFETINSYRGGSAEAFLRWLRGIAQHVILQAAQRGRRNRILYVDPDDPVADIVSPSRTLRRQERFDRFQEAITSLSAEHREVIILARIKGLRIKEIAERLNRSPNAVSLLLARALAKLRENFGDTESFHLPSSSLNDKEVSDAE